MFHVQHQYCVFSILSGPRNLWTPCIWQSHGAKLSVFAIWASPKVWNWCSLTGTRPESKRACEMAKLKIAHVNIVWLTYLIHYTKLHILDTHKSWYILHYYTVRLHQYHILSMKKGNSRFLGQHNMHNLAATLRSCQLSGWPTTKAVRHNFHVPNFLKKEILPIKNTK